MATLETVEMRMAADPPNQTTKKRRPVLMYLSAELLLAQVDPRVLIGFTMVLMAVIMSGSPATGTTGYIAQVGVNPQHYAILLALCGCLILRWPQSRWFTPLTFPFMFYLIAAWGYISTQPTLSFIPVIIYVAFYVLILRTGAEKRG